MHACKKTIMPLPTGWFWGRVLQYQQYKELIDLIMLKKDGLLG
jgi:hypothetical protein